MEVRVLVAPATSNLMIGGTRAASAIVYYRRGDILVEGAAPLAVGVFLGSLLGARMAPRIQAKYVVYLLVAIMVYLAAHLIVHLLRTGRALANCENPRLTGKLRWCCGSGRTADFSSCWPACSLAYPQGVRWHSPSSAPESLSCWRRP